MSDRWHCANCGRALEDGDEIQSTATGTWELHGASLGDHFIMCLECPTDDKPATVDPCKGCTKDMSIEGTCEACSDSPHNQPEI